MMLKRVCDFTISSLLFILLFPALVLASFSVFLYDFKFPLYIHKRVGKDGKLFNMYKLRSMIVDADKSEVDTTKEGDIRITPVGGLFRKYKIDEIPQLLNVMKGDMSVVGPRPNVEREVQRYTEAERKQLTIKPGITDLASIAFTNLGALLKEYDDVNLAYNQLVRPWKSRLGILYVEHASLWLDIKIILITIVAVISNNLGKRLLGFELSKLGVDTEMLEIISGRKALYPYHPPGVQHVMENRQSARIS